MPEVKKIDSPKGFQWKVREFVLNNIYVWLTFLTALVIMLIAFGLMNVSPFGTADKQILVTDLWHQYFPFLADFQDKLKHGGSLFWTWSVGGGVNYFSLMSYYVASPLNFITFFLPYEWLREFLMFSVAIKIALAGAFMAYFLRCVYKRRDVSLVIFGLSFSFCAFFMGYYWNTIWLDTVCVIPLVVLGAVKLLTEKKFILFTVSLSLSLLMNYYIGLFTCIFVLLVFIAYSIVHWKGAKDFFSNLLATGFYAGLAIGMTAFFLLPAYFALQNTHASGSSFPTTFAINIGGSNDLFGVLKALKSITGNLMNFTCAANKAANALPNISCGSVTLFFAFLSLTSKKIKLSEKIVCVVLVLFMFLSCIIRQLDYIWHGFHFTNMIPYRFSFLISFVIIVMGFRAFMYLDSVNLLSSLFATVMCAAVMIFAIGDPGTDIMFENHMDWIAPTLIASGAILAFIALIVTLYTKRLLPKLAVTLILTVLVVAQSGVTAYCGVYVTTVTGTYEYPRGEEKTARLIEVMKEIEGDNPDLWRAEMTSTQTLNDGALNHYRGLSMFNSMANESMTIFSENFGMMGWQSGNRYTYAEGSPVTNVFMNLKYLIARDDKIHNTYDMKELRDIGGEKLAVNEHYIPLGFMTDIDLLSWTENTNEDQFNPFDKQNEFFRFATGIEENVYTAIEVKSQGHTDATQFTVTKNDYGSYTFTSVDKNVTPHLKWNYEAPESGLYLMYSDITDGDDVTVMQNDEAQPKKYGMGRSYIACIGYFEKGDKISVYADLKQGSNGSAKVYVDLLNQKVFEQGYEKLSKCHMTATNRTDNSIDGTITVDKSGLFYTSIPYEEGWQAKVDGEEVEITPVGSRQVVKKDGNNAELVITGGSLNANIEGENVTVKASGGSLTAEVGGKTVTVIPDGGSLMAELDGRIVRVAPAGGSLTGMLDNQNAMIKPVNGKLVAQSDGNEYEIKSVGGSLVAFPLSEGTHEISIVFYPKGFWPGLAFSIVCALILCGMIVLTYAFRKKIPILNSKL